MNEKGNRARAPNTDFPQQWYTVMKARAFVWDQNTELGNAKPT